MKSSTFLEMRDFLKTFGYDITHCVLGNVCMNLLVALLAEFFLGLRSWKTFQQKSSRSKNPIFHRNQLKKSIVDGMLFYYNMLQSLQSFSSFHRKFHFDVELNSCGLVVLTVVTDCTMFSVIVLKPK